MNQNDQIVAQEALSMLMGGIKMCRGGLTMLAGNPNLEKTLGKSFIIANDIVKDIGDNLTALSNMLPSPKISKDNVEKSPPLNSDPRW